MTPGSIWASLASRYSAFSAPTWALGSATWVENRLDHAAAESFAVVITAVIFILVDYIDGGTKGGKQGFGHAGVARDGPEAERAFIVDPGAGTAQRHLGQHRERDLKETDVPHAQRAQNDGGGQPAILIELGNQLLQIHGVGLGRQQTQRRPLAALQHQIAGQSRQQIMLGDQMFLQGFGNQIDQAFGHRQRRAPGHGFVDARDLAQLVEHGLHGSLGNVGTIVGDQRRDNVLVVAVHQGVHHRAGNRFAPGHCDLFVGALLRTISIRSASASTVEICSIGSATVSTSLASERAIS